MSDWIRDYYTDVDSMNLDAFLAHHTDDAIVQFGNNPPAKGKEEIGQAIGGFWSMIGGLRHNFVNVWHVDGENTVVEAITDYTTHGGASVPVPVASLLHRQGDKVDSLRIYIDLAPLFAAINSEAD